MENIFKITETQVLVDCPFLELYLDEEFINRELVSIGSGDYNIFGVGNMRPFVTESQLAKRDDLPIYVFGMPLFFKTIPSEREILDVRIPTKDAPAKPQVVLRYKKGDVFITSIDLVKSSDNVEVMWNLVEDGKCEFLPYLVTPELLELVAPMNAAKNKVDISAVHTVCAERYVNPKNPQQKVRHMKELPSYVEAVNAREGAANSTSYAIISFEDINTGLLIASNRYNAGIIDKMSPIERALRGTRNPSTSEENE